MPVEIQQCDDLPITKQEIEILWAATRSHRQYADDEVTVQCVTEDEMQQLNRQYRQKDKPTNVLTFSYGDATHDVALCLAVAQREAREQETELRIWVARLLVHAFLHVMGLDHERSTDESRVTDEAELTILRAAGYTVVPN